MVRKALNGTYVITEDELNIAVINGKEASSTCPLCRDHRAHPDDRSLKIDVTTGAGYCHHCHQHVFVRDFAKKTDIKPQVKPQPSEKNITDGITPIDEACRDFLENRSIDPAVAAEAGIGSIVMHGIPYLAFPFVENGTAVNVQYKRADGVEKGFKFVAGGKIIPWNVDCLLHGDGKTPLYITEGMMDAVALMQSGYHSVISVPNGAGSKMEVFDDFRDIIKRNFSHIVFAGDNDEAGTGLRDRVKEYFSDTDVSVVKWKWADYTCKDANDMLECGGTDAVAFCIDNAAFDECKGLEVAAMDDSDMRYIYENGMPEGRGIGLNGIDSIIKYLPGYMYVITGYPGTGKSSFVNFVTMRLLKLYGWRTLYYTPEKMPSYNHNTELVSVLTGKKCYKNSLPEDEYQIAMNYIAGNVVHMSRDIRKLHPLLKMADHAIRCYGIKVMVIDPFFYLKFDDNGGMSETLRYSDMLSDIRQFAMERNIVMLLVAHPRKPGNNVERPRLSEMMYEVAGSSAFYNSCDVGIVLERPSEKNTILKVTCGKARFSYLGSIGETTIKYNTENGRYADCTSYGQTSAEDFSNWTYKRNFINRGKVSDYVCQKPF